MAITYRDFIHPQDERAIQMIRQIPGYEEVSSWLMKVGIEQYYHSVFMADHIRLSPTQLPKIYNLLPPICRLFGIDEPEFYLQMDPNPGAFTIGDKRTFLVITSGLLDHVTDSLELQSILAHECGHIVCRHVFYSTLAQVLLSGDIIPFQSAGKKIIESATEVGKTIPVVSTGLVIAGIITANAQQALLAALAYWFRRSELSCDRASALFAGNAEVPVKALLRIIGGPSRFTSDINIEEFAEQANDPESQTKWQKLLRGAKVLMQDHPFSTVRVNEIVKFAKSDKFRRLAKTIKEVGLGRACAKCGRPITAGQKFCRHCGNRI